MCHGATKSFAGLMVARFFLGVTESAVAPGFALLTGMFYKRKEQPSRFVFSLIQLRDIVLMFRGIECQFGSLVTVLPTQFLASLPTVLGKQTQVFNHGDSYSWF